MQNHFFRSALSSVLLTSALALAGCSGTGQEAPAAATQAQGQLAPVAANTHGTVKFVGDVLSQVPLRPDQRTEIEKLAADAEARHLTTQKAHTDLMNAFADQVQAGAVDSAALQPKIDASVAAVDQNRPQDRAAFQRLHDLLDASQRQAFSDAMKDKMHEGRSHFGHHGNDAKTADGASTTPSAAPDGSEHPLGHFGHMKQVADDLKLTDDQRSQIRDILMSEWKNNAGGHMRDAMKSHEHGADAMERFKADDFAVDKDAPAMDLHAKVAEGVPHIIGVAQKILPILTAEQRGLLAQKIRDAATSGGPMPF